ncbi:hypothetical protein BBP40_011862 [Aspergillus hancockii]|nr:hypothetical protein BBP40_011862 [Aspergillus hancockii]
MSSTKLNLPPRILRIPRSDDPESYVLLNITYSGPTLLDMNITATEGENPYTGIGLRAKNYQGNDDEWLQIVSHVFVQPDESAEQLDLLSGIESSASVIGSSNEDKELVITIRKRIQTITQRLGSVILRQDEQQAIQLFDWSGIAAVRVDTLERRLTSLLARYRSAEDTIRQLNEQLEEFISSKNQHEEQLIANFVQLLNEKKLKIRNQQRLLASAKVDTEKVSGLQNATSGQHSQSSKEGRAAKRAAGELNDDETGNEGEFEKMAVDQTAQSKNPENNDTGDESTLTPQPLEKGDNIATDEGSPTPSTATSSEDEKRETKEFKRSHGRPVMKEPVPPPPRRELPFVRKTQAAKRGPKSQIHQQEDIAEETVSETDDEL